MFKKLGVQLYTVRDYLRDPELADFTFARLAKMGYTEAHTVVNDFDAKLFGEIMDKHGISVVGTHYDYNKIINKPEEIIDIHRMWKTTNIGIGGMPGEARESLEGLKKFIADYNKAAEMYAKEGFKLTYHHHNFEFVRMDGYKTMMDILVEEFDPENITFVADTCWLSAGGADVCAWLEKLKGRIDILHLKDMSLKRDKVTKNLLPYITEVGNGNLSWDPIMETAEKIGVKSYVVEQDNNFVGSPFNSLKMSADFLAKYMK